ncbi:hypothetical protein C5B42_04205 [Candidatus Cerribacteria bacterium 'Amazon FNV 2010 28 9']|uniref:Thioredoxin-like fold domain-containing protein n=1 Tax=Candidatus Cerribacteria bacterium 'Amazon FNV 2010 28 9' TaxID=2081795 RepID=A0A317JPC6_9BACT|nr:MAG: hypothetical protein C5B42_04205 [Candidatus Cerribacteria bacterium 'Amazon FNV 2010 28 9']
MPKKKTKGAAVTSQSEQGVSMKQVSVPTSPKEILGVFFSHLGTILLIIAAFLVGSLWTEVRYLKAGVNTTATTATTTTTQQQAAAAPATPTVTLDQIKALFTKDHLTFGDANRKALFVEISDPSCPYCHAAGGVDPELNKQMGAQFTLTKDGGTYIAPVPEMRKLVDAGQASFVWIYYPGHGNGQRATEALYCANEKGKFWPVHDLLMSNAGYNLLNNVVQNDKTKDGQLVDFLKSAVDPNFLSSCLSSGRYDSKLTSDTNLATQLGVQGTPGFFINTTNYAGAYSWNDMKSTVDAALK